MSILIYISLIILLVVLIILTIYGIIVLSDLRRAIYEFQRTTFILNQRLPAILDNLNESTKDLKGVLEKARGNLSGLGNIIGWITGLIPVGTRGRNVKKGFIYSFAGALIAEAFESLLKKRKKASSEKKFEKSK